MRFISWLELAASAMKPDCHGGIAAVTLHPIAVGGAQTWLGVTMNGRWLRDHDGRLTAFDTEDSASRFLHLLKLDRFSYGPKYTGDNLDRVLCLSLDRGKLATREAPTPKSTDVHVCRRSDGRAAEEGGLSQS